MNDSLKEPDFIVFYWTGALPAISELSILSALNRTKETSIHVYLDSDEGFESSIPEGLQWLIGQPRLTFVDFRLAGWIEDENPKRISRFLSTLRKTLCRALNFFSIHKLLVFRNMSKFLSKVLGQWHPIFGFWPRTDPIFSIQLSRAAYRADVFRVLVSKKYSGYSLLYSDLDVYFSKPLSQWPLDKSFTYRWAEKPWANSAILFYHKDRRETSEFLVREVASGGSALPWFLFSDTGCEKAGIQVLEVDQFDPMWSPSSLAFEDSGLFFRESPLSELFLSEIRTRFLAVHWHNQWAKIPEDQSTFSRLRMLEARD